MVTSELRESGVRDDQRQCMLRRRGAQCVHERVGPRECMRNDAQRETRVRIHGKADAEGPKAREIVANEGLRRA